MASGASQPITLVRAIRFLGGVFMLYVSIKWLSDPASRNNFFDPLAGLVSSALVCFEVVVNSGGLLKILFGSVSLAVGVLWLTSGWSYEPILTIVSGIMIMVEALESSSWLGSASISIDAVIKLLTLTIIGLVLIEALLEFPGILSRFNISLSHQDVTMEPVATDSVGGTPGSLPTVATTWIPSQDCSEARGPSFNIGDRFIVPGIGTPSAVREGPNHQPSVGEMQQGEEGIIEDGPECRWGLEGGLYCWKIKADKGLEGWMCEGYTHSPGPWIAPIK